jgi:putative transposase
MTAAVNLGLDVGVRAACRALKLIRSSFYRTKARLVGTLPDVDRRTPPLALTQDEKDKILTTLNSDEFMDQSPRPVFAELLERGRYLCSVRTMYRLLKAAGQSRERRDQVVRPAYTKPELLATCPNQVWSWDITKLKGPVKWSYFYLYVIMDIYSRYVTGWMVAQRESAALAKQLIEETCQKQRIQKDRLTIHADRGSSMTSKPVAFLLADLGITKTHSRPHTSNDNPYSESQFKTLKYRPDFPDRFGSIEDARSFCTSFFPWYNGGHKHSGISFLTPESVHYGRQDEVLAKRDLAMRAAFAVNPMRFKNQMPKPWQAPQAAWINKPMTQTVIEVSGR